MGTMKRKEEQHPSFTCRTQTEVHTGNEPGPHANEVCEPEEQTLTSPGQCVRYKPQMNASNCQQLKISTHALTIN